MEKKYKKIIELSEEIENNRNTGSTQLILGWGCVICSTIFSYKAQVGFSLGLFIFGCLAMSLGYRAKKENKVLTKKLEKITK